VITATFDEPIVSSPTIAVTQQGAVQLAATPMSGSGSVYTYIYTVARDNGGRGPRRPGHGHHRRSQGRQ